jgi:hypothetical protein
MMAKQTTKCKCGNPNPPGWKQAAPGSGAIVYQVKDSWLRVMLSMRTANVGAGYGITGGGFIECGVIHESPVGTIVLAVDEAFRECCEENAGFENVIDADSFMIRSQSVNPLASKSSDINSVHMANMFALRVNDSEWKQMLSLLPGLDGKGNPEREEGMHEFFLRWDGVIDPRNPECYVSVVDSSGARISRDDFCHPHEYFVITTLAWMQQNNRLLS